MTYVEIVDSSFFACDAYVFGEWIVGYSDFGFLANEAFDGLQYVFVIWNVDKQI